MLSVYDSAIEKWGAQKQTMKAIEEMFELGVNLSKKLNGKKIEDFDIREEIADVMIMCDQLAIIYGKNQVEELRLRKIHRLWSLINND